MFSNDQNIETIGQLVDVLKHYAGLQKEYIKLGTVEKTVRILTAIAMTAILGLLLVFVLIFLSFAVVSALSNCLGQVGRFPSWQASISLSSYCSSSSGRAGLKSHWCVSSPVFS